MISTLVMQEEKRGDPSRKLALRLPVIAPKDDYSSSTSSSRSGQAVGPSIPPRARLPPRSRTGCWTCRSRKVKCDEGRPICGQCGRLGHNCDYSPRLSFRDDTPRVVERMQEISIVGSSIWDSMSPVTIEAVNGSAVLDDLPPFAQLGNDEERERKAERSSPGTYHVVVNPDSFQHMPEYSDDSDVKRETLSPLRRGSIATSLASSMGRDSTSEGLPFPSDPNTVILPRFEDVPRRVNSKDVKPPRSPISTRIKLEDDESVMRDGEESTEEVYLRQFHEVVWKQLVPAEIGQIGGVDGSSAVVVNQQAAFFEPLYHAMMAVAALSMASAGGTERVDALQHYEQALPALHRLKSAEEVSSDGVFLTHFLLLIYEIASAEDVQSNLWAQHLTTLLNITRLRREVLGGERYPYIVWWICNIDLDAMFTGAGTGEYVGEMLKTDIIPPPDFHLYPLGVDGSSVVYEDEVTSLPIILHLDYEVTILAVRFALLSQEFRNETLVTGPERDRNTKLRQSRIYELQESLRQCWAAPSVTMIAQNSDMLPLRSKKLFDHACTLYRACIIYSHTSMWSTQRLDTSPDYDMEIAVASNQILQTASRLLEEEEGPEPRFLVFPVFMAGFASTDGRQKSVALDLIGRMERKSIGRNTAATRKALGLVYEQQRVRFMMTGQSLDVDWMDVIRERNMLIVNFGL